MQLSLLIVSCPDRERNTLPPLSSKYDIPFYCGLSSSKKLQRLLIILTRVKWLSITSNKIITQSLSNEGLHIKQFLGNFTCFNFIWFVRAHKAQFSVALCLVHCLGTLFLGCISLMSKKKLEPKNCIYCAWTSFVKV